MVKPNITLALENLLRVWEELAPEAVFAEMTLAQFRTATAPALEAREQIRLLDQERAGSVAARDTADRKANVDYLLVVNSIKGSPKHGEDSPLYRSLGYTTKSERRSGLTRKSQVKPEAVAAN
ncbi:MAG: hypothetical protein ACOYM3_03410 [Terrimicrobiaceae bacterium]